MTFKNFYQPYTLGGSVIWFLWKNFSLIRKLCRTNEPEIIFPFERINKYCPKTSILAFNKGTPGPEQKITILGIDIKTQEEFFIKYAESAIARANVQNEAYILQQLSHLDFVPKLKVVIENSEYTLIKTNVLHGNRTSQYNLDKKLLNVLLEFTTLNVVSQKKFETGLNTCFSHGDFCPWNIMINDGKIIVYDWEMAGNYPFGYDLFTYIFQMAFLISPKKGIDSLLQQNLNLIQEYFNYLEILKWNPYLLAFAQVKLQLETKKNNLRLMEQYNRILKYAKEL
ncbi:MAG: phosphotransferase [Bacteroidota bacterium]|nr:phosphotransferase [Bacteroidota bacterium]